MYTTAIKKTLAVGASVAAALSLSSCIVTTDSDENGFSFQAFTRMSEEDIQKNSAQAVEDFYDTTFNPKKFDELTSLTQQELDLMKKTGNHHLFNSLSPSEKEKVMDIAHDVYELEDNIYGYNDLSEDEKVDLIIAVTLIQDFYYRYNVEEVYATVNPSLVEVGDNKDKAYVPDNAIEVNVDGEKTESMDFDIVVDGHDFLVDPHKMIQNSKEAIDMADSQYNTNNALPSGQDGVRHQEPNNTPSDNRKDVPGDPEDHKPGDNPVAESTDYPDEVTYSDSIPELNRKFGDLNKLVENSLKEMGHSLEELEGTESSTEE